MTLKNHQLGLSMLQLKRSWDKRMFFFFYNQISFPFSFSCLCLMRTLKRQNIIEFVRFSRKFFISQNSTFRSSNYRSSCPKVFCKKEVHKNFTKFRGKCLCQSFFLNKVAGLAKFLRTPFLTDPLQWLLF